MKKIYLIVVGAFLIFLIIISILLSLGKRSTINTQNNPPFPTGIPLQGSNPSSQTVGSPPVDVKNNTAYLPINISAISPVETSDFKLQYSSKLNKIVVEKKTPQAEEQFENWANQNQLTQLVKNPDLTIIVDLGKNPDDFNPLMEFLNIFMNFGQGTGSSTQNLPSTGGQANQPSTTISPQNLPTGQVTPSSPPNPQSPSFTFFAQCNGYGNISLPDGCNLCEAGCGSTTVSMIASSYLGNTYDPKTIVDIYKSKGYLLGCDGSHYTDAYELLKQLGLKTTNYFVFNEERSDTVAPQLKKYLDAGYTFFALARFCDDPKKSFCGHYFWITDIDDQGNIWAYDPYYGRYEIPYNENSRYPYPLYSRAFGVKK
jgi:hypothetical protein